MPGRPSGCGADEREQLLARLDLGVDAVLDVRPVEARDEVLRIGSRRRSVISRCVASVAVAVRATRGTPGNCSPRSPRVEVVGAEVVAPLRHAVGLVDRDDAQGAALQERARRRVREPLGGDVDEVELAREVRALDGRALRRRLGRVEVGGADAVGDERVDLVVHERDERADDEARALADERGDLVDQALAAAGRHEHDRVAAGDDLVDRSAAWSPRNAS